MVEQYDELVYRKRSNIQETLTPERNKEKYWRNCHGFRLIREFFVDVDLHVCINFCSCLKRYFRQNSS